MFLRLVRSIHPHVHVDVDVLLHITGMLTGDVEDSLLGSILPREAGADNCEETDSFEQAGIQFEKEEEVFV